MMLNRLFTIFILNMFLSGFAQANSGTKVDREVRCLALNIYFEARGEAQLGRFAVAAVTMNRVKSYKFPKTVCKVVWQRRQFSWTHDGKSDRPTDKKAWREARALAKMVYSKYFGIQEISKGAWDITQGALHYYSISIPQPYWAKESRDSKTIGKHMFVSL